MSADEKSESYLELFDISQKVQVAKVPLTSIRFIPRIGERVFVPLDRADNWKPYTVVNVEYFIGEPNKPVSAGAGRVTLYVEESK
jgi:hypothetical protein